MSTSCDTQASLQATLDDKRNLITALTDAAAVQATKTTALVESYEVLGVFGWYFGDFFIDNYPTTLEYTGIFRSVVVSLQSMKLCRPDSPG